jgi:hypothetical protein
MTLNTHCYTEDFDSTLPETVGSAPSATVVAAVTSPIIVEFAPIATVDAELR